MTSFNIGTFDAVPRSLTGATNDDIGIVRETGEILGFTANAVTVTGTTSKLFVYGSIFTVQGGFNPVDALCNALDITVGSGGLLSAADDYVIEARVSRRFELVNAGEISSTSSAMLLVATADTGTIAISNSGHITGTGNAIEIFHRTGAVNIVNSGEIVGNSKGLFLSQSGGSGRTIVQNSGTISGIDAAYQSGAGADVLRNAGLLQGAVQMGAGNDVFDSRSGVLAGDLSLGEGNDKAYGSAGADSIAGEGGLDTLRGMNGDDTIDAGAGDDQIWGCGGDDSLAGGAGIDLIIGGAGSDTLRGGTEADTFVFGPGFGTDVIQDFEAKIDHIDLRLLGVDASRLAAALAEAASVPSSSLRIDLSHAGAEGVLVFAGLGKTLLSIDDFLI